MVIDDNRRSEFRNEVSVPDSAGYAEPPCADEVDAPDWPPIDDALPQLRAQQQAMIRPPSSSVGHGSGCPRSRHPARHSEIETAFCRASAAACIAADEDHQLSLPSFQRKL